MREINEAALRLSSSANQVLAASTQHETSSTEQAAAIHETTATMEELKHASAQIAENAGAVARVAEETLGAARAGRGAIGEFIQAMQQIRSDGVAVADSIAKLSKRVERIGTVVEVIDEIADRSDLLALNAALEGSARARRARASPSSRRRCAGWRRTSSTPPRRSRTSSPRSARPRPPRRGAADASKTATESGEKLGAVAAQAVEGILAGVQETSDAARVINLATQQQRTATEQVVASMAEIEDVTRQTTQASKQATGRRRRAHPARGPAGGAHQALQGRLGVKQRASRRLPMDTEALKKSLLKKFQEVTADRLQKIQLGRARPGEAERRRRPRTTSRASCTP